MLYLINCRITKIIFDEEFEENEMNHIVEAESEEELAKLKIIKKRQEFGFPRI